MSGEIDARKVVEALVPLNRRRDDGNSTSCSCPNPDHEDRNPSFSLNFSNGMWTCWSQCGTGNLAQLLVLAGRARTAAEGWKLIEKEFGPSVKERCHRAVFGRPLEAERRSQWSPSRVKEGQQTGPNADELLEHVAGMVKLSPERLTKWQVTICERRHFGGKGGPTVMVARVPISKPDGSVTGGWDRVLMCETDESLVGEKRSLPTGSGGGDGSGIWLGRLSWFDALPDWLLVTAGLTDGAVMSALAADGPGASSVCVISAASAGTVSNVVESVMEFWQPTERRPRLGLMLDDEAVDNKEGSRVAAMWPGGVANLRPLLPKGCKDARAAAAVWDDYYAPLGEQWTKEIGALLGKMLDWGMEKETRKGGTNA